MKSIIVLDSSPLGLLLQRTTLQQAEDCRAWLRHHLSAGTRIVVPEIVHYELKRELLRLRQSSAVTALMEFSHTVRDRYIPLTTQAMDLAAEFWADARQRGFPTADRFALDVDVILSAQVLTADFMLSEVVVATSNVGHLSMFVPAAEWQTI